MGSFVSVLQIIEAVSKEVGAACQVPSSSGPIERPSVHRVQYIQGPEGSRVDTGRIHSHEHRGVRYKLVQGKVETLVRYGCNSSWGQRM